MPASPLPGAAAGIRGVYTARKRPSNRLNNVSATSGPNVVGHNVVSISEMAEKTCWETINAQGAELVEKLKQLVREGNVRRVVVKQGGRTIAEFPLTAGVVGAVFAPVLAAIGALLALANDCTIEVERAEPQA